MRGALRTANRQHLVDFINTLEDVERNDDSDPDSDSGFWRRYVKQHLFIAQFYLPELNRTIGIELEQTNLDAIRNLLGYLATDLYCGTKTAAEARGTISSADNISQLQRVALLEMVDVYDRGARFPCVDWTP